MYASMHYSTSDSARWPEIENARPCISPDALLPSCSEEDCAQQIPGTPETLTPPPSPTPPSTHSALSDIEPPPGLLPATQYKLAHQSHAEVSEVVQGALLPAKSAFPADFRPPPGLLPPLELLQQDMFFDTVQDETLNVTCSRILSATHTRAVWRIRDPLRKLHVSCNFPLISPSFTIGEFQDARLVFTAGASWQADLRAARRRKARTSDADPKYGSLQLKVTGAGNMKSLCSQLYFSVGDMRHGPLNMDDRTVQGCDIKSDWRAQVKNNDGGVYLCVCVDLLQV